MVPLTDLWLPILLSAVFVFILSSIVHMVLAASPDRLRQGAEAGRDGDGRAAAVQHPGGGTTSCRGPTARRRWSSPEYIAKRDKGPVAIITIFPFSGPVSMGQSLGLWFVYCVAVGIFRRLRDRPRLRTRHRLMTVFRFAGTTAYALATRWRSGSTRSGTGGSGGTSDASGRSTAWCTRC